MKTVGKLILAILISTVPSVSLGQVAGATISEQQDYAFTIGLYKDGQYALALQQFNLFLRNHPDSHRIDEITFLSGECLLQEKMYDSALSDYEKVINHFPSSSYYVRSELRYGEVCLQLNKLDRAEKFLKEVLSGGKDSTVAGEAAYKLGQVFTAREDYGNGIKYFELSYEGYRNSGLADYAMYGAGWCLGKLGEFDRSKERFGELLASYPDTKLKANAIEKIGECDFFTGDYPSAIKSFEDSSVISSENQIAEPALYYEGRAHEEINLPDSAMLAYNQYLNRFPSAKRSSEVRVLLSKLLISTKTGANKALQLLSEIKPDDPVYFESRLRVGDAYEAAGSPDSAESTLLALIKSSNTPDQVAEANYELGKLYFANKSYSKSEEAFLLAAKDAEFHSKSMKSAAVSAASGGDYQNAQAYFQDAIRGLQGKDLLDAQFDYAAALYAAGNYANAAQVYTAARNFASSDKDKSEALYMAAESSYRARDYDSSLARYKEYLQIYPDGIHGETALLGEGYSRYFSNDLVSAAQLFQRFIDKYPQSNLLSDAYLRLGDCFYHYKDYAKALEVYRTAATKFQGDTSAAYALYQEGESNFWLGRYEPAIEAFHSLLGRYPASSVAPDAQYAIGWVHFTQKEYPQAIGEFDKVRTDYPNSPAASRALYSEGDAYYNSGKYEEALKHYSDLLSEYPSSEFVDNAIVGMQYSLTVLGRAREAESVIDNFVRDHPSLPHVDRIFYKKVEYALDQNHYTEAERYSKEFIVKFPQSSLSGMALYNLALVEIDLGKEKTAIGVLTDLIGKKPGDEYTSAGKIKLAEIYQSMKNYDEAEKLLSEAASSEDTYGTAARVDLGRLYLQRGDTLHAESILSNVALSSSGSQSHLGQADSANDEKKAEAKVLLSQIYFSQGRVQDAIQLATSVSRTREDHVGAEAQLKLAEYYCASGDTSDAVVSFLRVKYVFPGFSDLVARSQLELADCLTNSGNVLEARSTLQEFIKDRGEDSYTKLAREKLRALKSQ